VTKCEEEKYFFNWDMENENPLKGGYHSLVGEVFNAANQLQIGISYDKNEKAVNIWTEEVGSLVKCYKGQTAKAISEIVERRHFMKLRDQPCRGQSIETFKKSRMSNFYIGNCKAPVSDALVRFSLRCRNDTQWTPARKALIFGKENHNPICDCGNHRIGNLLHILNNCDFNLGWMTDRHNAVQQRVVEAIAKHRKVLKEKIRENVAIKMNEEWDEISGISMGVYQKLRPDIWYWLEDEERRERKLIIIEFAIPYGKRTDEISGDTLKETDHRKRIKYAGLVKYLKEVLGCVRSRYSYKVIFKTIVISSLGAVPGFTIRNFSNIIGVKKKNQVEIWVKRMVIAALKGSFNLWMKAGPRVYGMMQTKVSLEKLERKNERLGLRNDDDLISQDLKTVMLAEVEGKEIDDMIGLDRMAVDEAVEFFEPQKAEENETEDEQEIGLPVSEEVEKAENEECLEMLGKLNAPEVERGNDGDVVEVVKLVGSFLAPDSGEEMK
jgi:hypothetical protein